MNIKTVCLLLLLGFWGLQPPAAAESESWLSGKWKSLFGDASDRKKQDSKKKRSRKKPQQAGKAPRTGAEQPWPGESYIMQKEDPVLGKQPLPRYTDFSGLNRNLRKMESAYRSREYKAYRPLDYMWNRLKVGSYSSFENPTGIYFEKGQTVTARMTGTPRTKVELVVRDFGPEWGETRIPLDNQPTSRTLNHKGHAYIHYRDTDPDTAPAIRVDIQGGVINGVFTHHDDARVWKHLLANAKSDLLDIMGERCQWVLDLKALRARCPERGPELVAIYDRMILLEQRLLGWEWEGIHPGNHIMGRVMWKGYMHADGLGGAYHCDTTPGLVDVDAVIKQGWGTAHEFGHVNQTRRGMVWTGTTETTVNIFSQLVNLNFNPTEVRLEHEHCPSLEGIWVRGGRFDCYVNSALVNRELWQFQRGPDDGNRRPGERCGDCFVILCPMWQMYLYNTIALGNNLFYPRIFKSVRDTDESKMKEGEIRMKYLDRCCDAAQLDFSDFFLETGMLATMNRYVNDYGSRWMTVTEDMCRQALEHARQYPRPESPVVFYITTNNMLIYRDKLNIKPSPAFKPQPEQKNNHSRFVVPGDQWANAVAFEVYNAEEQLIRICLRGLDQKDNSSTTVILPEGAARVMAVQWDGARYTIYSTTGEVIDDKPDSCTGPGAAREEPRQKRRRKKR